MNPNQSGAAHLSYSVSLFATPFLAPRARRPLPRVSPRKARPAYALKYGTGNVGLFELLNVVPVVAPYRSAKLRYLLETKDPFGEWANAYHDADEVRNLRVALETLPHDYDASASFIRAHRPRRTNEALKFWNAPIARAHALNAVLMRADRPMSQVHTDLALKHDKLYSQFQNWGVEFARQNKRSSAAILQDAGGTRHDVRVVSMCRDTATAMLRLEGLSLTLEGRYDARGRVYRTSAILNVSPEALIPASVAAAVLGLSESAALTMLPVYCQTERRGPLVESKHLARVMPADLHRMTLSEALSEANPCKCVFYNVQQSACGLAFAVPPRGSSAYSCEDYQP